MSRVLVNSEERTVRRNDDMVIFRRRDLIYVIHRNLSQSKDG